LNMNAGSQFALNYFADAGVLEKSVKIV
jgi:hypothetical protein